MSAVRLCLVLVCLLLAGCSGKQDDLSAKSVNLAAKITQFYASPSVVPKGEKALVCYGVESASSVSLEPAVEKLTPALTRCFEVRPEVTTTYKLTAVGRDGAPVTQSVTVQVGGARPKFNDLSVNKAKVRAGEEVQFCFAASNATSVQGSPGKFMSGGKTSKDCLVDKPSKTTTYTITIRNAQGMEDSASMRVEVR